MKKKKGTWLWHRQVQRKLSASAQGTFWRLPVAVFSTEGIATFTWPIHQALLKHSKLCFQRAKLLFLHKRPDQRFSYRWELRSKSDYFQRNPPFSTCQLTMSVPLCLPWKSFPFWHNGGWMHIIAFTAIYSCRRDAHPTPTLLPSFPFFFLEKSGPHAPEERKVL